LGMPHFDDTPSLELRLIAALILRETSLAILEQMPVGNALSLCFSEGGNLNVYLEKIGPAGFMVKLVWYRFHNEQEHRYYSRYVPLTYFMDWQM